MLIYRLDAKDLMVHENNIALALTYTMWSSSGETEDKNGGVGCCMSHSWLVSE